jgi:hypothetical protein
MSKKIVFTEEFEKGIRWQNIVCGGLIAISLIILQDYVSSDKLDIPAYISMLALAISLPLLSGHILLNAIIIKHKFILANKKYASLMILYFIGSFCAVVGVAAAIWHVLWIAALIFVVITAAYFILQVKYSDELDSEARKGQKPIP